MIYYRKTLIGCGPNLTAVQLVAQGADDAVAVSLAIATRLVTLWMGILLGVISLMAVSSRLTSAEVPSLSESVATQEDA